MIARNDGANATAAASSAPPMPAAAQPTSATVCVTGPGVSCPNATALRNSPSVIQRWRSTASSCISGMATKPPPYESAPTLNAVHARPGSAAAAAITTGQACSATRPRRRHASSRKPAASSTSTTYGPMSTVAAHPAAM